MSTIEESVDVGVPVTIAYNQWTQFEQFPLFMEGVDEVRQIDDTRLHWKADVGGRTKEWDAKITEQRPDRCVAWTNTDGARNAGEITFERIDPDKTRVIAQMDVEPEGLAEKAGDALGLVKRRVKGDLARFKEMIEARGSETGGWRGEVQHGRTTGDGGSGRQETIGRGTGTKPSPFQPHS
jgi:uncharacterized membrane protein